MTSRHSYQSLWLLALATAASAVNGCDCANSVEHCGDASCIGGNSDGGDGGHAGATIVSIALTPANETLTLVLGTSQTLQYTATATYSDGSTGVIGGTFGLGDYTLGTLDAVAGVFVANGNVGGSTAVSFTASGGQMASTGLTIDLTASVFPTDAGTQPGTLFADAGTPVSDPTAAAVILYPVDQVMFPQNITSPVVQWNTDGGANDWYRVTYAKPHMTVTDYVQNQPGFTFSESVPNVVFASLAETDPTAQATVEVDRLDVVGNRVISGTPVHMSFAQGSVSGTVYYWAMDEARLHRLPGGTTLNQPMFPSIVGTASTDPGYTYSGCVACHQISRDGRYLAAAGVAAGGQAYVFDLTAADPTLPNMPVATRAGYLWYFASISPDNSRIFSTSETATFGYTDINLTAQTPTGTVPSANMAHPNWSPDGKTVAFISNVSGWATNASFDGGDLTLVNVDLSTDVFSNIEVIHEGGSLESSDPAGGAADCFPSWTPDSKYLMFAHTANTRGTGETRFDGSLYIMPPQAGATPVRMATASDSAGHAQAHYPNTSPFTSGGFYWIVFYSTRDYGNTLAGTQGTGQPQLWVSAISTSFDGTHDPSSVPYYLPGQSTQHENADAVWAASACKATDAGCLVDSDCCSGTCDSQGDGGYLCVPPTMCRREGESCNQNSDCCAGLPCDLTIHTCQASAQ
jgi:hypothetical protein